MKTQIRKYATNHFRLIEALKIQTDRQYKHLFDKAVSLEVDNLEYYASNYKPEELRYAVGEKLNEIVLKENRQLREDFYNSNSRGC